MQNELTQHDNNKALARAAHIYYFLLLIATNAIGRMPPLSFIFLGRPPLAGVVTHNHLFTSSVNRLRATLAWKSGSVWHRRHCLV